VTAACGPSRNRGPVRDAAVRWSGVSATAGRAPWRCSRATRPIRR